MDGTEERILRRPQRIRLLSRRTLHLMPWRRAVASVERLRRRSGRRQNHDEHASLFEWLSCRGESPRGVWRSRRRQEAGAAFDCRCVVGSAAAIRSRASTAGKPAYGLYLRVGFRGRKGKEGVNRKKNFKWGAAHVRELRRHPRSAETIGARIDQIEEAYVALFRAFGPRFDEGRFRAACEV